MKTIGVIGGIGPQATMDFEARIHRVAQREIPQRVNGGYPPMIVYYHRRPPFVLGPDMLARQPLELDPAFAEALPRIGALSDFIVITANGPHLVVDEVERLAGRPVLSLVGCAVDEVQNRKWRRVGVIGMGYPKVYVDRLEKAGIAYETIEPATQSKLNRVFLTFMEGRLDPEGHRLAADAVAELQGRGVDGVILGCTELPLILPELEGKPGLLNPAQVLAERAIRRASATKPTEATESTKSTELGAVPAIGVR